MSEREPLEVERLVSSESRRLTVAAHQDWREAAFPPARPAVDEIDLAVADVPNPPAMRKRSEVSRVLSILDEIGRGDG